MRKICVLWMVIFSSIFLFPPSVKAQSFEVTQLLLNVEKLNQFRQILQGMYDGYKIVSDGYNRIRDVTSGNFKLHDFFLDGLYLVSPEIKKYRRVADIISYQIRIVKEYKSAYNRFKSSGAFTIDQIEYLGRVYGRLFDDSLKSLDELLLVITARQLRMTDDERLTAIDRIYVDVEKKLHFLRRFNQQQAVVAFSRMKEKGEIETLKILHGIK